MTNQRNEDKLRWQLQREKAAEQFAPQGAYEGHVKYADSSVMCVQCHDGRHDECFRKPDGYWCECSCWELEENKP